MDCGPSVVVVVEGFGVGNFFVIPDTSAEAWEADTVMALHKDNLHVKMGYELEDAIIAIVGSQFLYRGLWLENAIILQALLPVLSNFPLDNNSNSNLEIVALSEHSTSNYGMVFLDRFSHHLIGYLVVGQNGKIPLSSKNSSKMPLF